MPMPAAGQAPVNYFTRLYPVLQRSTVQLVRRASHPRAGASAQRLLRATWPLLAAGVVVVVALMFALDASEIGMMPPRGAASLWLVRIITDFGKAAYVLSALAGLLLAVALAAPVLRGVSRANVLRLGTKLQFLFFAVLVPVLAGEVIKWIVGRGRPFVGGEANAFNFAHFAGTEAYASFPSAHAITGFALAFAVAAVWPRARVAMMAYAVAIAATRLVLLAHHPSDVVAGALIGVVGAMLVRYWFAVRGLGFAVDRNGAILPLAGPAMRARKGVAREASAP